MASKRLIIAHSKSASVAQWLHVGLGISALNIVKALRRDGVRAEVWPIAGGDVLWSRLHQEYRAGDQISHVVICALFIPTEYLARLATAFPYTKFVVNCHSNVGFLQSEPEAINKFRGGAALQVALPNVHMAGNSLKFVQAMHRAYGCDCLYLPNLYFLTGREQGHRPIYNGGVLRVGIFGASRIQKNFSSAINACLQLARQVKAPMDIYMNSGRNDGHGDVVTRAARAWTNDVPGITLKEIGWQFWPDFRQLVEHMNLLIQVSYSETFNQVTADGCAAGVPTVVGEAIDWLPTSFHANVDDPAHIAEIARHLLYDPHACSLALESIQKHNARALPIWRAFLDDHGNVYGTGVASTDRAAAAFSLGGGHHDHHPHHY